MPFIAATRNLLSKREETSIISRYLCYVSSWGRKKIKAWKEGNEMQVRLAGAEWADTKV